MLSEERERRADPGDGQGSGIVGSDCRMTPFCRLNIGVKPIGVV